MTNDGNNVENHTIALLREIRERLTHIEAKQEEHSSVLSEHSQTLGEQSKVLDDLVNAVTVIDRDQQLQTELLKELTAQGKNHCARLNAMDGRLGLIEKRLGLVDV